MCCRKVTDDQWYQCAAAGYLDEVDVVLSARQLGDLTVSPLQVSDFMGQTLHVAFCVVECCPLVGCYELGHLLLHPLDGAHHVTEHLLTFLQCSLGWGLHRKHGGMSQINRFYTRPDRDRHHYQQEGMLSVLVVLLTLIQSIVVFLVLSVWWMMVAQTLSESTACFSSSICLRRSWIFSWISAWVAPSRCFEQTGNFYDYYDNNTLICISDFKVKG